MTRGYARLAGCLLAACTVSLLVFNARPATGKEPEPATPNPAPDLQRQARELSEMVRRLEKENERVVQRARGAMERELSARSTREIEGPAAQSLHLRLAAAHLTAAGMPELAAQLTEYARTFRLDQPIPELRLVPTGPLEHRVDELAVSVDGLGRQLEEIQRGLRELRRDLKP